MNRVRNLPSLYETFAARLNRMEKRVLSLSTLSPADRDPVISYVTIEVLNSWTQFAKNLFISCAMNARNADGKRITCGHPYATVDDVIGVAVLKYKPHATPNSLGKWQRRDEPTWHDSTVLLNLCAHVNCSHLATVQAAFALNSRVFQDLPVFRNFFAHRNQLSMQAAQNVAPLYGLPTNVRPAEVLMRRPMSVANFLLVQWITEQKITAEYICTTT